MFPMEPQQAQPPWHPSHGLSRDSGFRVLHNSPCVLTEPPEFKCSVQHRGCLHSTVSSSWAPPGRGRINAHSLRSSNEAGLLLEQLKSTWGQPQGRVSLRTHREPGMGRPIRKTPGQRWGGDSQHAQLQAALLHMVPVWNGWQQSEIARRLMSTISSRTPESLGQVALGPWLLPVFFGAPSKTAAQEAVASPFQHRLWPSSQHQLTTRLCVAQVCITERAFHLLMLTPESRGCQLWEVLPLLLPVSERCYRLVTQSEKSCLALLILLKFLLLNQIYQFFMHFLNFSLCTEELP